MIVGNAICKVLDGMTIEANGSTVTVLTDHDSQDSLDKFIAYKDDVGKTKYPLNFYVTGEVYEDHNGWKSVKTDLVILMDTQEPRLAKVRAEKVYIPYIEPIYQKVKTTLNANPYIEVIADRNGLKYPYVDRTNYGITIGDVGSKKQSESVVTDYVDARIIKINLRIKTNCI